MILILLVPLALWVSLSPNSILHGVAKIIELTAVIANVLMSPINELIETSMPDLSGGIEAVDAMFDLVNQYMGFLLDATLIPQLAVSLIVSYYIFSYGLTFSVWGFKTFINWWRVLK